MHFDVCISFDCLPNVSIDYLNWHAAEHSAVLTQVSMNATSLFCLPATILVLMSKHPSLSNTYGNNRCEPFKDGCIIVSKKTRLMSLGQTAQRQLITRGLGLFLRSWVKKLDTQETIPRHVSIAGPWEKEFQLTPSIPFFRLTWTHTSSHWPLKIAGKWAVGEDVFIGF